VLGRTILGPALVCLGWAAFGCESSTGPVGPGFADYHFRTAGARRYYEEIRLRDTFVIDTTIHDTLPVPDTTIDTTPTVDTLRDTLVDSLWRIYTDAAGVEWAQSVVKPSSVPPLLAAGAALPVAVTRKVGLQADTIFVDENLRDHVLEGPLVADRTWLVRSDGTISARLLGEETLDLWIGPTAAWHVTMGAVADEWWALGLGRVRYEEFDADGIRVRGVLIALEQTPTAR
jgi:hypothetical protein